MTDPTNAALAVEREGPAPSQRITLHCTGCKHLRTEYWKECPDGEPDSGTSAVCMAVPTEHGGKSISAYWDASRLVPTWCPFLSAVRRQPARQAPEPENEQCSTGASIASESSISAAAKIPTSREIMLAGGVDPDAPFEVGHFPKEMRQHPSALSALRQQPEQARESASKPRKLTMPNGDTLSCEYPDRTDWAKSWTSRDPQGRAATGEQDWELVESYGLTAILEAALSVQPATQAPEVGAGDIMSEQAREALDDEWGCEYCRNDGRLNEMGCCPKCDAQFDTDPAAGEPAAVAQPAPGVGADGGCQDCDRWNPVWCAPSPLWNLVMGGPEATDDPGGVVCPACFIKRAEAAGIVPHQWLVTQRAPGVGEIEPRTLRRLEALATAKLPDSLHSVMLSPEEAKAILAALQPRGEG